MKSPFPPSALGNVLTGRIMNGIWVLQRSSKHIRTILATVDTFLSTSTDVGICPFCNGSAVCASNSLAFRDPDVADELVPSEPLLSQKLSQDSHKKVSWKCDRGEDHLYEQLVFRRTDVHAHCPFCMSSRVCKSNSLETRYPELGREFDEEQNVPLTADSILPTSTRCVWWKCSQGHQWKASVKNRVKGMGYCKVCGANRVVSLETVCPALSTFWDYDRNLDSSPRSATIGSQHYAHWICSRCQRGFRRRISDVYKQFVKNGSCCCPNCASDLP